MSKLIIRKVAVLGAGVMGAQIAAHCANAQHRHLANDQSAHAFLLLARPAEGLISYGCRTVLRRAGALRNRHGGRAQKAIEYWAPRIHTRAS